MKTAAVILITFFTSLAYGQGQPEWFINAYGDTLYSRCCVTTLELDKGLTAAEIKAERKELRIDKRLKRRFDRTMNKWYRRDQKQLRKQPFGDEIISH
jgi:hypothetical protein